MEKKDLTPKQVRFVEEYLKDLNATQAAARAGYSAKSASKIGFQLLEVTRISDAIREKMDRRSKRTEITADRVLLELGRIAFADTTKVVTVENGSVQVRDTEELDEGTRAALSEVSQTTSVGGGSIKVKLHDKVGALRLLCDHLGLLVNKHEITGKDGAPLGAALATVSEEAIRERLALLRDKKGKK